MFDCRLRSPEATGRLRELVAKYNPDYFADSHAWCRVCRRPAFRNGICGRHYRQIREGVVELTPYQQIAVPGQSVKRLMISLSAEADALVRRYSRDEDVSLSAWVAGVIYAELERRTGKKLGRKYVVLEARVRGDPGGGAGSGETK